MPTADSVTKAPDHSKTPSDVSLLRKHMPELDVLRGVAILVVLLYHGLYWSGVQAPRGSFTRFLIHASVFGWLGVNLFFVLSGFLITGILLDTKQSSMYYSRFYRRRALRILPAYLAMIVVCVIVHAQDFRATVLSLLFLSNYAGELGSKLFYGVFWSLGVEEQFYLVWPAIVRNTTVKVLTIIGCALCVIEPILRGVTSAGLIHLGNVSQATYLIADNLALGVLAAIFARSRYGTLQNGIRAGLAVIGAGGLLLLIGIPFGILHRDNIVGDMLQTVPWNLIFTGLLLLMLGLRGSFFSGPWTAPLRFLGYISYGLYLVHVQIFNAYAWFVEHVSNSLVHTKLQDPIVTMVFEGALAVFVAWLSRRFYEEPFLARKVGGTRSQGHAK